MKTWTTKDGIEIPLRELDDNHIHNIKLMIEQKTKKGLLVEYGSGCLCVDDYWYDCETLYGEDAKRKLGYEDIIEEIERRQEKE